MSRFAAAPTPASTPDHAGAHEHAVRHTAAWIRADAIVDIFETLHHPTIAWHDHDFYELAIIESGRGRHVSDAGVLPIEPGVAIFLQPGVGHEYRHCEDLLVYNCLFRAELANAELMWAFRDPLLAPLFEPAGAPRGGAAVPIMMRLEPDVMRQVIEVLDPIRLGSVPSHAGQLGRLLLALEHVASAQAGARAVAGTERHPSPLVTAAIGLLDRDLAFPWTLDELSRRLFVGRFHLARSFARCVGQPPMHYLTRLRAERAAALLSSTELPVAAIGVKVGWPDPAYFSRRFRGVFGSSPRAYRQRRFEPSTEERVVVKDVQEQGKGRQVGS